MAEQVIHDLKIRKDKIIITSFEKHSVRSLMGGTIEMTSLFTGIKNLKCPICDYDGNPKKILRATFTLLNKNGLYALTEDGFLLQPNTFEILQL